MTQSTVRERPILFSGPMVRAILGDQKSVTRRVIRPQPPSDEVMQHEWGARARCPYGAPGDRLYVRETWHHGDAPGLYCYRADTDPHTPEGPGCTNPTARWRPAIHMPRIASRILLEITRVSVERVRDIDVADAWAEGTWTKLPYHVYDGESRAYALAGGTTHVRDRFRLSWDELNAKRGFGWAVNPWVWVVHFRRLPS